MPDPPPVPAPAPPPAPTHELFQFTGKAGEYFGIWIVNLFLTIATLGIYSAWAKVRKKRYFYGNTWVAGCNFDYHGNPVAILKGRLLAFAAFAAYTLAGQYSPKTAALIALVLMPAVPWLLVRSFAFNAVNSSYRNLRFHFRASYRDGLTAVGPILVFPLLALVLPEVDPKKPAGNQPWLWLLFLPPMLFATFYPYVIANVNRLRVNHGRYGTAGFTCSARTPEFYGVYVLALVLALVLIFTLGVVAAGLVAVSQLTSALLIVGPALYVVFGAVLFAFTRSRVANLVFNSTQLASHVRPKSTLKARRLARIYAGNALAVIVTLGLAIPWAAIRTARYRAECLALECVGGFESFAADVVAHVPATGEEMGDMFDVDLSL